MAWFLVKIFVGILIILSILGFLKSLFKKLFLESGSTSSPSDGDNDIAYEPPPESQPTPSASSSDQIKVVIDSGTVKPQQHVQSSSKGSNKVSDQNSKESSPLLNTISSNQPTVSYTPSKPSASSSNLPQSSGVSSSRTVKPQHVQSSIQTKTNEVSHSSKTSIPLPPTFSSRPLQSPSKPSGSSSNLHQSQSPSNLPPSSSSPSSSLASPPYSSKPPPSTSDPPLPFTKQPPGFKPILYTATNNVTNEETKRIYMCENGTPLYAIPEDIKALIKRDIVPPVLKQPLSPSTYKAYFAALLYAEDYELEKWDHFLLEKVTLELEEAAILKKSNKDKYDNGSGEKDDKTFVQFKIDSVPEKRPFLLSRDMVYARPSGKEVEPFQGFIYRVVKGNCVLVEFGDDFHSQHHPNRKYDISFSFNRVCLKRAHQAIDAAIEPLFHNFLFPECITRKNILNPPAQLRTYHDLNTDEFNSIHRILSFRGSPPYLLGGPLIGTEVKRSAYEPKAPSRTSVVVCGAVNEIYRTSKESRILICAPINRTCDVLMEKLMNVIPESDVFRANAAFRERDDVPIDILRSCPLKGECFVCPSLQELRKFRIILSTYVSSFRLYNEGIIAGHFSHIFLVDASSTTEPEATIALANFANENTTVIVTGAPRNRSGWVRSSMARKYGLGKSYFERLHEREPYKILNPMFITELVDIERPSYDTYSSVSFY
ncbi:putative helicase MOV-10 [Fagus crenata]